VIKGFDEKWPNEIFLMGDIMNIFNTSLLALIKKSTD
jgi:hypothetical protein